MEIYNNYLKIIKTNVLIMSIILTSNLINNNNERDELLSSLQMVTNVEMVNESSNVYISDFKMIDIEKMIEDISNSQTLQNQDVVEHYDWEKELIYFYSKVYSLDGEKVYKRIAEKTNNFQSDEYLNENAIGEMKLKNREITSNSKEFTLLLKVREIYFNPGNNGFTKDELYTNEEYVSVLDYSQIIGEISKIVGIERELCYGICIAETGLKTGTFSSHNNPSGIKFSSGSWASFPSEYAGIIEQALENKKYMLDGNDSIITIGKKHAMLSDVENSDWYRNVITAYNEGVNDPLMFEVSPIIKDSSTYILNLKNKELEKSM